MVILELPGTSETQRRRLEHHSFTCQPVLNDVNVSIFLASTSLPPAPCKCGCSSVINTARAQCYSPFSLFRRASQDLHLRLATPVLSSLASARLAGGCHKLHCTAQHLNSISPPFVKMSALLVGGKLEGRFHAHLSQTSGEQRAMGWVVGPEMLPPVRVVPVSSTACAQTCSLKKTCRDTT